MSGTESPSVLVTSLGLMGGSLAAALHGAGWRVELHHHRPEVALAAERKGWGRAVPSFHQATADIVVICTPVSVIPQVARQAAAALPRAVITDVGSTKRHLCAELTDLGGRFIGSHPMCGSHRQGLDNADPDLYRQRLTLLTPGADTTPDRLELVRRMWRAVGCRLLEIDPETHDRLVAEASHLPHVLASLAASQLSPAAAPVCAGGFRDTTRVASASSELWADILVSNAAALAPLLTGSAARLEQLGSLLAAGDRQGVTAWLAEGRLGRGRFDALHALKAPQDLAPTGFSRSFHDPNHPG